MKYPPGACSVKTSTSLPPPRDPLSDPLCAGLSLSLVHQSEQLKKTPSSPVERRTSLSCSTRVRFPRQLCCADFNVGRNAKGVRHS